MAEEIAVASANVAFDYLSFYNILIYLTSVVFVVFEISFFLFIDWYKYNDLESWIICLGLFTVGIFFIINLMLINKRQMEQKGRLVYIVQLITPSEIKYKLRDKDKKDQEPFERKFINYADTGGLDCWLELRRKILFNKSYNISLNNQIN